MDASGGGAPLLLCIKVALQVAEGGHCGKELLREGDGDGGNGAGGAAVDALRGAPRGAASGLHLGRDAQACGDAVDAGEDRGQDVVHRPQCHDLQRPAFDHHWHLRVEACVQWEIMHSCIYTGGRVGHTDVKTHTGEHVDEFCHRKQPPGLSICACMDVGTVSHSPALQRQGACDQC